MKIKSIFLILIFLVINKLNIGLDFEEYSNLENLNNSLIMKEDLPEEFSEEAYNTIIDFIQKTKSLDYEWMIFFDYFTGEILKCVKGEKDNVGVDFDEEEFEGHNIASIHNHPSDVYSPPSDKNFGILLRNFEDYELIVGQRELWILKAKYVDVGLNVELKVYADLLLDSCQDYCRKKYGDDKKAYDVCDIMYGVMLSNYINDKSINHIQLTKKEYEP